MLVIQRKNKKKTHKQNCELKEGKNFLLHHEQQQNKKPLEMCVCSVYIHMNCFVMVTSNNTK